MANKEGMASKQGGLLVTLGKKMLGFSTSPTGCCGAPAASSGETSSEEKRAAEVTPADKSDGGGCCGSSRTSG